MSTRQENTNEKSLMVIDDKNIFHRLINFLKRLIRRKDLKNENEQETIQETEQEEKNIREDFIETLKVVSDPEIISLTKRLENNEISVYDLTDEQVDKMISCYQREIENEKMKIAELKLKGHFGDGAKNDQGTPNA